MLKEIRMLFYFSVIYSYLEPVPTTLLERKSRSPSHLRSTSVSPIIPSFGPLPSGGILKQALNLIWYVERNISVYMLYYHRKRTYINIEKRLRK